MTRGSAPPPNNVGLTVELKATDLRSHRVVTDVTAGLGQGSAEITSETLFATVDIAVQRLAGAGCRG